MVVRAPLVEAEQDGSIRIQDLTKVVMARRRLGLAEEPLVPFEAAGNVAYANDRPCAFHRISVVGLTRGGEALLAGASLDFTSSFIIDPSAFQHDGPWLAQRLVRCAMWGQP